MELLCRRIRGREAVARDTPFGVVAFLEDEQLLVRFGGRLACGMVLGRTRRIRANICPRRRHDHELRDGEPHVKFQLVENGIVGFPHRLLAYAGLAVGGHKSAVVRIKRQHRSRLAAIQSVIVRRQNAPDLSIVFGDRRRV